MGKNVKHFIVINGEEMPFFKAMLAVGNAGAYFSALTKIKRGVFSGPQQAWEAYVAKKEAPKLTASQGVLARYARERQQVIAHYTGGAMRCSQCSESRYRALCIDHVNGDGAEARKGRTSQQELRKIIEAGFPDCYQILCHNCNYCKYFDVDRDLKAARHNRF